MRFKIIDKLLNYIVVYTRYAGNEPVKELCDKICLIVNDRNPELKDMILKKYKNQLNSKLKNLEEMKILLGFEDYSRMNKILEKLKEKENNPLGLDPEKQLDEILREPFGENAVL